MPAINTTQQLAKVRAKIDAQQQIIGQLEGELQIAILGGFSPLGDSLGALVDDIVERYDGITDGSISAAALREGVEEEFGGITGNLDDVPIDQTALRHMLYQARALLGELRIEEQQWNTEVNEEKQRRKDLTDFAKG